VYRWEPIEDGEPVPTLDWLRSQVAFIDQQRKAGRAVFVHCDAGVSRSGLVSVAYFMRRDRLTRDEALAFLRRRRPDVQPNQAFMILLAEWENSLTLPTQQGTGAEGREKP
jgi:protein-tyrosine phosphatase